VSFHLIGSLILDVIQLHFILVNICNKYYYSLQLHIFLTTIFIFVFQFASLTVIAVIGKNKNSLK